MNRKKLIGPFILLIVVIIFIIVMLNIINGTAKKNYNTDSTTEAEVPNDFAATLDKIFEDNEFYESKEITYEGHSFSYEKAEDKLRIFTDATLIYEGLDNIDKKLSDIYVLSENGYILFLDNNLKILDKKGNTLFFKEGVINKFEFDNEVLDNQYPYKEKEDFYFITCDDNKAVVKKVNINDFEKIDIIEQIEGSSCH